MPRRKIPTKAELIQLQKLYKTDEKIAERIGNVTPQLVAYWRRKKNIPKHSFPKFSEPEIRDIWERFGDDYRCGLELGISKAAFYNWRRKYGLKEKPSFLKLEQLELNLGGPPRAVGRKYNYGGRTISQKILAERAGRDFVEIGENIEVEPDLVLTRGETDAVLNNFERSGHTHVFNPNRLMIALEYNGKYNNGGPEKYRRLKDFIRKQSIKNFYDVLNGTCHQLIIENGLTLPGQIAVASDNLVTAFGCINTFGFSLSEEEIGKVWETGKVSLEVPQTVKVIVNGKIPPGVFAKDIILFVARKLRTASLSGKVLEFNGATLLHMSISERFTMTGVGGELDSVSALCSFDSTTRRFVSGRTRMPYRPALADKDALYHESYEFNVAHLSPQIAGPNLFDNVKSVSNLAGVPVQQVIIGGAINGRFDDLRIVADIFKGRKISPDVRTLIIPASHEVYLEALKKGLVRSFIESGVIVANPGFEPFLCANDGLLAAGERCLTTSCCGHREASVDSGSEVYMVSPATAAASAIKGVISDPTGFMK